MAADLGGRARVNRDALRLMLHDGAFDRELTEPVVNAIRSALIRELLALGISVAVDDTNLPDRVVRELGELARAAGARVETADLRHVSLRVCIERDAGREGSARVGAGVITEMYRAHICPAGEG